MAINLPTGILFQLALEIILAIILALLAGPIAVILAKKLSMIDVPGSSAHKKHSLPTPLAGGLVLLLSIPILFIVFHLWVDRNITWMLIAAFIIVISGIIDDIYGLSAPQKFILQLVAAFILTASGISVKILDKLHLPLAPWTMTTLNYALTLFWLVGVTNAFNLIDSMDGLVTGLAIISSGFFMLISLASEQVVLAELSAILFGISISLYFYNMTPAHFFLGDSGSQTLGFMLAAIGILYTPPNMPQGSTWFMPILLLGIPIFDTTLVVVSRIRRRKPIFKADLAHTYHRLVRMGMAPGQAVLTIQITALLLCNSAFIAMSLAPQIASLLFLLLVLLGIGLIIFFEKAVRIES